MGSNMLLRCMFKKSKRTKEASVVAVPVVVFTPVVLFFGSSILGSSSTLGYLIAM